MKNLFVLSISFLLLFLNINNALYAQDLNAEEKVVVILENGKEFIGKILSDDGREVLLLTENIGKVYIKKENIKEITPMNEMDVLLPDNEYRNSGPFTTRHYFTTNALPIKKREDYAMIHLYGPEVHFSLSDRLSVGVMTTWIASPFVLALKYSIPTSNKHVNFGIGTMVGTSGYLNNFKGYGGLHWGMLTLGNRMKNVTFSAGYAYINTGQRKNRSIWGGSNYGARNSSVTTAPVVSIAGIAKVGKKASFIFDSMLFFASGTKELTYADYDFNNSETIFVSETIKQESVVMYLMPGMRFQSSENKAFQVALAGVSIFKKGEEVRTFPLPMCSWFIKF